MQEQEEKLLSVKEFAAAAGVTTQSIYAACKGRLQPFCKQVGKKTIISAKGLQLYESSNNRGLSVFSESNLQADCKPNLQTETAKLQSTLQAEVAKLQNDLQSCKTILSEREQLLTAYKEEVSTLSGSLEHLQQQLTAKDVQIAELTSLLQTAQQSTQAALQAAGQAQIIAYQGQKNVSEGHSDGLIAKILARFKR